MGFAEKPLQIEGGGEGGVESEVKKWVIAGISLRSPLKPIFTKSPHQKEIAEIEEEEEVENSWSTPTSEESRIPRRLTCPPPPRKKPKPSSSSSSSRSSRSSSCEYCMSNNNSSGVIREFFTPPHDFENIFARRAVGRAAH